MALEGAPGYEDTSAQPIAEMIPDYIRLCAPLNLVTVTR